MPINEALLYSSLLKCVVCVYKLKSNPILDLNWEDRLSEADNVCIGLY